MGITIEDVELWAKRNNFTIVADEWWANALDIICKYRKIEDIYYHQSGEALENSLRAVIEDANECNQEGASENDTEAEI